MEDIRRILAVSWITQYCKATIQSAVSLAAKYDAELSVIHVVDTSWMQGWNLPMMLHEEEHQKEMERIKAELNSIINREKKGGMKIKTIIKEGDPVEEILKVIEKEKIDLVVLRAHEAVGDNDGRPRFILVYPDGRADRSPVEALEHDVLELLRVRVHDP